MNLTLVRDLDDGTCTLGKLTVNGDTFDTMERPWIPDPHAPCGQKAYSCVPKGTYQLKRHTSEAHPRTWALVNESLWVFHFDEDVPLQQHDLARTLILVHSANWAYQLLGCIAPGLHRLREEDRWMVTASQLVMERIQRMVPWTNDHTLSIE